MGEIMTDQSVDAHVRVDWVRLNDRHRRDLGDVQGLADSIREIGLLHPIVVTRDGMIVVGERRLAAYRLLGYELIPARYADTLDDAVALLHAERDENLQRKDMLPSELASLGAALYELEAPGAKARQQSHAGTAPGRANTHGTRTSSDASKAGPVTDLIGPVLGMSGRTYQELRYAHRVATDPDFAPGYQQMGKDALDEMDRGGGIARVARTLRGSIESEQGQTQDEDHDWVTTGKDRTSVQRREELALRMRAEGYSLNQMGERLGITPTAVSRIIGRVNARADDPTSLTFSPHDNSLDALQQRQSVIAEMASTGHTSDQIAHRLGIRPEAVRARARSIGVKIPADVVFQKTRRHVDSNRVVAETVDYLSHAETALGLVDFAELDLGEVEAWTTSLTQSIKVLNQLNKRLKEMTQ